jgi:hypothetical protein
MKFNVFINAEDEDDLNDKIMDMECVFNEEDGSVYDNELIDIDTEEYVG